MSNFAIVIPSRNPRNLAACVAAIREQDGPLPIIVIDDGLDRIPDGVTAINGKKPFVFSRNVNLGIGRALADCRDGVVIMNDDAILCRYRGLSVLAQTAAEHPEYGLIASSTNNVGNIRQRPIGMGLRDDPVMVCFICVYVPKQTLTRVGLLDERFTAYGWEDNDYSRRVRNAGMKIGIQDNCFVNHAIYPSSFRGDPAHQGIEEGRRIYVEKWGDEGTV